MIKADVYYRAESDQLVIVTPVYVLQEESQKADNYDYKVKFETYLPIGYAVDNGEIVFIIALVGLLHFEKIGEL